MNGRNYRHGYRPNDGTYNSTYAAWKSAKGRCMNPNNPKYPSYGGRGITMCERWLGKFGFNHFLEDMGDKPQGMTLGRIDNDGPYTKDNCRWEWPTQQAHNRRSSLLTEEAAIDIYKNKPVVKRTRVVYELAAKYGVKPASIYKIWDGSNWGCVTSQL